MKKKGTFAEGGGRNGLIIFGDDGTRGRKPEVSVAASAVHAIAAVAHDSWRLANPTAATAPPTRISHRFAAKRQKWTEDQDKVEVNSSTAPNNAKAKDGHDDEDEEESNEVYSEYLTANITSLTVDQSEADLNDPIGDYLTDSTMVNSDSGENIGVIDSTEQPNTLKDTRWCSVEANHMQDSINQYKKSHNDPNTGRAMSRVATWLETNTSYRDVNYICNNEAEALGEATMEPNLPQFAATHLDPFLDTLRKKVFTATLISKDDPTKERAKVTVVAYFRDFEEAVTYRVVANAESNFAHLGNKPTNCGSLSETFHTSYFHAAVDEVLKETEDPDLVVCPLDIFSDGTHINSFGSTSIQPIEIEIGGGYSRHLRATKEGFSRITAMIGWVPVARDSKVFVKTKATKTKPARNGYMDWSKLSDSDQSALGRLLQKQIYEYLYQELAKAFDRKVYQFPYEGMSKVVFVFSSFKGDQPEKNRWCAAIGCQICDNCDSIILGTSNFRKFENQGRLHDEGFRILDLKKVLLPDDPWKTIYPPDLMHTFDNVATVHLLRLVSLILCDKTAPKNQIRIGQRVLTATKIGERVKYFDESGDAVSPAAKDIPVESRVTKREDAARDSDRWTELMDCAKRLAGSQAEDFFKKTGGMKDREYGFAGLILALYELLPTFEDVEDDIKSALLELVCTVYLILVHMQDAAVGFNLETIESAFETFRDLWLELSADAGIVDLPISVHVFCHYPQMIRIFGAPLLYSLFAEETNHTKTKSTVLHNSNRQQGESNQDYLKQVMRRQGRLDVLQFWKKKYGFDSRTAPRFATIATALPEKYLEQLLRRKEECITSAESVAKLLHNKFLKEQDFELPSNAASYGYYECSIHVINQHQRTVVAAEKFQSVSALGEIWGMRAMALAPKTEGYNARRLSLIQAQGGCCENKCFACCAAEYSSTLLMNQDEETRDEYYIPLGFRKGFVKNEVFALALRLDVVTVLHGVLFEVSLPTDRPPVEVSMARFRDCCNVAMASGKLLLLERMRGRLS